MAIYCGPWVLFLILLPVEIEDDETDAERTATVAAN